MSTAPYGMEVIIDLAECDPLTFTRERIEAYMAGLCDVIDMQREDLHFWDYNSPEEKAAAPAQLKGTSAVQFILTSNITLHSLDDLRTCYINIFSCKDFDPGVAAEFTRNAFGANSCSYAVLERG